MGATRVVRRYALNIDVRPEEMAYRDDGCDVAPACLRCPLPACKYDDPYLLRRGKKLRRDLTVMAARSEGLTVAKLAERFNVAERTIYRVIARARLGRLPVPMSLKGGAG